MKKFISNYLKIQESEKAYQKTLVFFTQNANEYSKEIINFYLSTPIPNMKTIYLLKCIQMSQRNKPQYKHIYYSAQ